MVVAYTALALASDDQVSKMISRVGEEVRANPRMSASDVIRIMKAMETEATATATASGDLGHMLRLGKNSLGTPLTVSFVPLQSLRAIQETSSP